MSARFGVRFYGYKHWTLEDPPRCFNVGKGLIERPYEKGKHQRSHKWHAIVKRLGLHVEVCVGPMSNQRACIWEMQYIPLMGTRSYNFQHNNDTDIGCNFTDGGEGASGSRSPEACANMKKGAMGRKRPPPPSEETCVKKSKAKLGDLNPAKRTDVRAAISKTVSKFHREQPEVGNVKLTLQIVNEIRAQHKIGMTITALSKIYRQVSLGALYNVVHHISWKEIDE